MMLSAVNLLSLMFTLPVPAPIVPHADVEVNLPETFGQDLSPPQLPPRPGCDDDDPPHCQDDPLLPAKLQRDRFESDLWYLAVQCDNRRALQVQRANFERLYRRRIERVRAEFARQYGSAVTDHGHLLLAIRRCQRPANLYPQLPTGSRPISEIIGEAERFLGIQAQRRIAR